MLSQAVAIRLASLTAIVTLALMAALLLLGFATRGALFGISRFAIHYLFPFSLFAALALAGLAAQRVEEQRFAQRALDRFARRGSQARELLCGARRFGGDQPPPLRAVGR